MPSRSARASTGSTPCTARVARPRRGSLHDAFMPPRTCCSNERGHVATITLNRPAKLNAVTGEMCRRAGRAGHALQRGRRHPRRRADRCRRAGVQRGLGHPRAGQVRHSVGVPQPRGLLRRAQVLRKPVIAAVNGYALGGGLETALICDIRLASTNASFAAAEIKLGWIGGGGMTALLDASIGPSNAALMLLTGDPIDAERALHMGLVSEVVEPAALRASGARAGGRRSPPALRSPPRPRKANLRPRRTTWPLDQAVRYERDMQTVCFATAGRGRGQGRLRGEAPTELHQDMIRFRA